MNLFTKINNLMLNKIFNPYKLYENKIIYLYQMLNMNGLIYNKSDAERFLILKSFYEKQDQIIDNDTNAGEVLSARIEKHYNIFEKLKAYESFVREQKEKEDQEFKDLFNKAKIFVVHYFQALYMAIERGELSSQTANYYGLDFPFEIPNPKRSENLLKIAEDLFNADAARIADGGKYFSNPSLGAVRAWVEKFKEVWLFRNSKLKSNKAEVENIENIRKDSDKLIYELYELLDKHLEDLDIIEKAKIFAEYGLIIKTGEENTDTPINNINEKKRSLKAEVNQLSFDFVFPEN